HCSISRSTDVFRAIAYSSPRVAAQSHWKERSGPPALSRELLFHTTGKSGRKLVSLGIACIPSFASKRGSPGAAGFLLVGGGRARRGRGLCFSPSGHQRHSNLRRRQENSQPGVGGVLRPLD